MADENNAGGSDHSLMIGAAIIFAVSLLDKFMNWWVFWVKNPSHQLYILALSSMAVLLLYIFISLKYEKYIPKKLKRKMQSLEMKKMLFSAGSQ